MATGTAGSNRPSYGYQSGQQYHGQSDSGHGGTQASYGKANDFNKTAEPVARNQYGFQNDKKSHDGRDRAGRIEPQKQQGEAWSPPKEVTTGFGSWNQERGRPKERSFPSNEMKNYGSTGASSFERNYGQSQWNKPQPAAMQQHRETRSVDSGGNRNNERKTAEWNGPPAKQQRSGDGGNSGYQSNQKWNEPPQKYDDQAYGSHRQQGQALGAQAQTAPNQSWRASGDNYPPKTNQTFIPAEKVDDGASRVREFKTSDANDYSTQTFNDYGASRDARSTESRNSGDQVWGRTEPPKGQFGSWKPNAQQTSERSTEKRSGILPESRHEPSRNQSQERKEAPAWTSSLKPSWATGSSATESSGQRERDWKRETVAPSSYYREAKQQPPASNHTAPPPPPNYYRNDERKSSPEKKSKP